MRKRADRQAGHRGEWTRVHRRPLRYYLERHGNINCYRLYVHLSREDAAAYSLPETRLDLASLDLHAVLASNARVVATEHGGHTVWKPFCSTCTDGYFF